MNRVYLILGTNLGEKKKNIEKALSELEKRDIKITKMSNLYITTPWGYSEQPDFLNLAVESYTNLDPFTLLREIKNIEIEMGRVRTERYGPRVIDIDIIFYNDLIIKTNELTIPHPLMHERYFVLKPLSDIAPNFLHPELHLTVRELLNRLL